MAIQVCVSEVYETLKALPEEQVGGRLDVAAFERDALVLEATKADGTKVTYRLPYDETQG